MLFGLDLRAKDFFSYSSDAKPELVESSLEKGEKKAGDQVLFLLCLWEVSILWCLQLRVLQM